MKKIYKQIARQNQTTPAEVEREISALIEQMWQDAQHDPQQLARLRAISATGGKPTPEEMIFYFARQIGKSP